jgi:hypothetical protein
MKSKKRFHLLRLRRDFPLDCGGLEVTAHSAPSSTPRGRRWRLQCRWSCGVVGMPDGARSTKKARARSAELTEPFRAESCSVGRRGGSGKPDVASTLPLGPARLDICQCLQCRSETQRCHQCFTRGRSDATDRQEVCEFQVRGQMHIDAKL